MKASITEYLNTFFPFFEPGLKDEIASSSIVMEYEPGAVLMRTGQYIKSSIMVVEGRVKIYREGPDGEAFFLYDLVPGEGCALSMICAMKNETSELKGVVAERTTAILVPSEKMDEFIREYKSWYHFVLQTYRKRFDEMINIIENIAFRSMDERLLYYLQQMVNKSGENKLQITHQEIANDLNSSREVISRLLKKMENMGYVNLERNQIEVLKDLSHVM